jgi:hypothetical protein
MAVRAGSNHRALAGSSTPLKVWNSNRMEERPSFVTDTSISITSSLANHAEEVAFDVDAGADCSCDRRHR